MTPEAFEHWSTMRGPVSRWRKEARAVMVRVVSEQRDLRKLDDDAELLTAIDKAYPFGVREHLPYRMWLLERSIFRTECQISRQRPMPTREEAEVCVVARDLVEVGRVDEARALVREQAPNRLSRKCPACGATPGRTCREPDEFGVHLLVVPHHARLVGHRDAGPLFEARS